MGGQDFHQEEINILLIKILNPRLWWGFFILNNLLLLRYEFNKSINCNYHYDFWSDRFISAITRGNQIWMVRKIYVGGFTFKYPNKLFVHCSS
jgi:hypothetical protein